MMWLLDWKFLTSEQLAYYVPFSTDPQYCRKWYDEFTVNTRVLHETCTKVWPAYLATITKLDHAKGMN